MKSFITFLFAWTTSLANAQAILPAGAGQAKVKSAGHVSPDRMPRHQRVKPFAINPAFTIYRGVGDHDEALFDGGHFIEMNRFAGYVLQYERTGSHKIAEGKKEFRNYEMARRARMNMQGFSAAVNAIMQMRH